VKNTGYKQKQERQKRTLYHLSCVNFDGYIEGGAEEANGTNCCVRPTFWLKAE